MYRATSAQRSAHTLISHSSEHSAFHIKFNTVRSTHSHSMRFDCIGSQIVRHTFTAQWHALSLYVRVDVWTYNFCTVYHTHSISFPRAVHTQTVCCAVLCLTFISFPFPYRIQNLESKIVEVCALCVCAAVTTQRKGM